MKHMLVLLPFLLTCAEGLFAEPRPELVAKVASGELKEARASWWGFDPEDSTRFLQAAINSRVPRLIIDRTDTPWTVLPLRGVSNQELFFERGAVVQAKRGEYKSKGACLLTFSGCSNITLRGYGATVRMWHEDYMNPPYEKSEWRHALSILSSRNVLIEGLTVASSGGDGIYIGSNDGELRKCVDVVIRDVLCHDNHRQGISVITAENLLIENTVMRETHGTPPAAGIDFEPNKPEECLKNCVMRNCLAVNNEGCGFATYAAQLNSTSDPISIRFENCTALGNREGIAFTVNSLRGYDVGGEVTIKNCSFEKSRSSLAMNLNGNRFGTLSYDISDTRIVSVTDTGAESITPVGQAWLEKNLPLLFDKDFAIARVAKPDLAQAVIHDAAPGTSVPLQPMKIRGCGTYIFYADAARTIHFSGRQCTVGRHPLAQNDITIRPASALDTDKPLAKIPLPGLKESAFTFDAPAPGFYRMSVNVNAIAFVLGSCDAPIALDLTGRALNLISSTGSAWFFVPEQTPKFAFLVSGEGVERVRVTLHNPSGERVWDQDDICAWDKFSSANPASGLWRVTLSRPSTGCFEDSLYDLAGIPGFLFLSDKRTWTCR